MPRFVSIVLPLLCALLVFQSKLTLSQNFNQYTIPTPASSPASLVAAPDGKVWFTESSETANRVGNIDSDGIITEFQIPTANARPRGITVGPDNNLWVAFSNASKVARVTPQGAFTEFSFFSGGSEPRGIVTGPDGNLWITLSVTNKIARLSPTGQLTEFDIPTASSFPEEIAAGPDGALWFTQSNTNKIGRITTTGSFSEFTIPTADSFPQGIAAGPDGNIWFTELIGNKIGRITPAGIVTEYDIPTPVSLPYDITMGPNGLLWFAQALGNKIASVNTDGEITEYSLPTASSVAVGITTTANGDVWFAESSKNVIGRMTTVTPGLHLGPVFSSAQAGSRSFIRLYNTSNTTGAAIIRFADSSTGITVAQWTENSIPAGVEIQVDITRVEQTLGISNPPASYTVTVAGEMAGYAQHVLWRSSDGTLTNLSTCNSGNESIRTEMIGVHSSLLANGYPSSISISNPSTTPFTAALGIYNAGTGTKIGSYTSGQIPSGGHITVPVSQIENDIAFVPSGTTFHYIVKAEGRFPGFMQHVVTNQQSGVVTDMTAMCALIPGS